MRGRLLFEPRADVTTDMVITNEETLGSVAPLYRFKTDDEAVKMANDNPHPSLPRARGRVWRGVNRSPRFGGMKESGIVREVENTASWNSSRSNTSAPAVQTAEDRILAADPGGASHILFARRAIHNWPAVFSLIRAVRSPASRTTTSRPQGLNKSLWTSLAA